MAAPVSQLLRRRGPLRAADVRAALGVSAATLSRLIVVEPDVARLGAGRATVYALARALPGLPSRLPVFRVSARGAVSQVAEFWPLDRGATWVVPVRGKGHQHVGPPPVIMDMAPSGYLGRRFADRFPELQLPPRLQDWSVDHMLVALARRGEDVPGDLIVGEESADRFLQMKHVISRPSDFPRLAEESARGSAGSSAGGEHPKFLAAVKDRHCLVKFSPGDGSPTDLRWRDLLVCEALALDVLREAGLTAPAATVVDAGPRRFLQVDRFDRVGLRGRRGVLSLGPIDDSLFGGRDTWSDAAARFGDAGLLSGDDVRRVRLLDAFGSSISNGDRHFGNLSFFADGLEERPKLSLAPVYDMLPMDAAPRNGFVPDLPTSVVPRARWADVWEEASTLAAGFWTRVASDKRISSAFRDQARRRT